MKTNYINLFSFLFAILGFHALTAQCPAITCQPNVTINNDPGNCGAVYNFTAPVGTNPCGNATTTFNYTGSIQTWTVPAGVTSIHIVANGAQGGHNNNSTTASGLGASMSGDFAVTPGQQLKILVGQQPSSTAGNGGGGGSFVTDNSNTPLIVAGGGGGSSQGADSPAKNGQTTTSGGTGAGGGGVGGINGNGGSVGGAGFQSGAGGGLLTNGADGWTTGTGGFAFVNGGSGGTTNAPANGGFGGGGSGSSYVVGGGGGGYSGGGSGGNSTAGVGGGGGSYNSGTNQANTSGANSGNGQVVITYSDVTTTLTAGLPSGSFFPLGSTTETFTVTDLSNNTASCSFTVTVVDNENPTIIAPSNISVSNDAGLCSAVVNYNAPVGTDNCSVATTVLLSGIGSGGTFPVGTTTETYQVTDGAGNTSNCSFTVTVNDNEPPVFSCPSSQVSCVPVVNGIGPGTVTDNCSGVATVSYALSGATTGTGMNDASGNTFNPGITTVTYTATDANGNPANCSFDVNYDPAPSADITSFSPDTLCINWNAVPLPSATPPGGIYSGAGVSGNNFDPSIAGMGSFWINYTYTNGSGCMSVDSTNVTVDLCLNVDQKINDSQIHVYPNPTSGLLFIDAGKSSGKIIVRITEMSGRLLKMEEYNGTSKITTNISDLSSGIYLLEMEMDGQTQTMKLIRE